MENNQSSKELGEKKPKLSLRGYYLGLPRPVAPKTDFVRKVSERCGVDVQTVRNWCLYGMKPNSKEHIRILSEMTGIEESELWED